ncbi:MAG: hypothetical protein WC563_15780 [Brevundimonas sp.]
MYDRIHANMGDAITQASSSVADVENKAAAREIATADRAIERRIVQEDPLKLTEPMLSRREAIMGISASINDSMQVRRARVAARELASYSGGSGSISTIVETSFSPWTAMAHFWPAPDPANPASAKALWLGSTPAGSATDWYSTVALITIEYIRPANGTDEEAQAKADACRAALDEYLPAWTTFCFSETYEGDAFGFYVGVSRLGFAALSEV